MSWPSGTKASTQNVDQGGDKISLARADIKQNIDNVNDIIDHLNIASPSNGDLLQYSSSSGKWEQVASTGVGQNIAICKMARVRENIGGGISVLPISSLDYNAGFLTNNSDSAGGHRFTLTAGTYSIHHLSPIGVGEAAVDVIELHNATDSQDTFTIGVVQIGSSQVRSAVFGVFTIASTKEFEFRLVGDVTGVDQQNYIKFEKLA